MSPIPWQQLHSHGGYENGLVRSALQKAIRRGEVDDALFWGTELALSGNQDYLWKALKIITSEDVGLGDPNAPAVIRALYENWQDFRKEDLRQGSRKPGEPQGGSYGYLMICHAIAYLALAPKNHLALDAVCTFFNGERPFRAFKDEVFDKHTAKGRQMGRGVDHFVDVSGMILNVGGPENPYFESSRTAQKRPSAEQPINQPSKRNRANGLSQLNLENPSDEELQAAGLIGFKDE